MPPAKKATASEGAADHVSVDGATMRRTLGEQEHEDVKVKLAHYLPEGNEFTEKGTAAEAGTTITVKRHQARHLIGAGYAAVDPEDAGAVAAALQLGPGEPSGAQED